ncbi:MAG: hypothetical protein Q4C87_07335 [Actinomycetaceae bacterium]|nr:hypothetical protein [Actinomycetaceae bacterium]
MTMGKGVPTDADTGSISAIHAFLDRDSVSMGDDVFDHRVSWELPATATIADFIQRIWSQHFLASVVGNVGWLVTARAYPIVGSQTPWDAGGRSEGDYMRLCQLQIPYTGYAYDSAGRRTDEPYKDKDYWPFPRAILAPPSEIMGHCISPQTPLSNIIALGGGRYPEYGLDIMCRFRIFPMSSRETADRIWEEWGRGGGVHFPLTGQY